MAVEQELAERFAARFNGNKTSYGTYQLYDYHPGSDEKRSGKALTVQEEPKLLNYQLHLEGKVGLGIVPIRGDDTCLWGAIDIDEYGSDFNGRDVALSVYRDLHDKVNIPCVVTFSKSGGLHIWFFFSRPVFAGVVQKKLVDIASAIGFPGVEVFPKQSTLKTRGGSSESGPRLGNWINLPYFNQEETDRYAIATDGVRLSLSEFLDYCDKNQIDADRFSQLKVEGTDILPFADGPPCLQKMARQGVPQGGRDNSLYQMAVYLVKKGYEGLALQEALHSHNTQFMNPPLSASQVQKIFGSFERRSSEYHYKCNDAPMREFCNRNECIRRDFGVTGGGDSIQATIEVQELTKYVYLDDAMNPTDNPAFWDLTVNGVVLRFTDDELLSYPAVKKRIFSTLDMVLPDVKKQTWDQHLRGLLERVNRVPLPSELSLEGKIKSMLQSFIIEFAEQHDPSRIKKGRVYYHVKDNIYVFQIKFFLKWCLDQGMNVNDRRIQAILIKEFNAVTGQTSIGGLNTSATRISGDKIDLSDFLTDRPEPTLDHEDF